jgi:hypothetical protein
LKKSFLGPFHARIRTMMMNRRLWFKSVATAAAAYLLRPRVAEGFSVAASPVYFPNYVNVGRQARLWAKTVLMGHETGDFLLSTTGGE